MKKLILLTPIALALALGACTNARDTRMAQGALIGGAGGATVGAIASGSAGGAVVGGVAGAAAGAVIADATRPQTRPTNCYWSSSLNRQVCSYR